MWLNPLNPKAKCLWVLFYVECKKGINYNLKMLKRPGKPTWRGQFMTKQQQAAKLYMACFPRVAGWVKKARQGQGECWRGSCFQWFWVARFVSCSPHSLLKDVKHIQRMSVATNENKPRHTAIKLPTGRDQSKLAQVKQQGMGVIFVWNPNMLYLAANFHFHFPKKIRV